MLPSRMLEKTMLCPSGLQSGYASYLGARVTFRCWRPSTRIVCISRFRSLLRLPLSNARYRPLGDHVGLSSLCLGLSVRFASPVPSEFTTQMSELSEKASFPPFGDQTGAP